MPYVATVGSKYTQRCSTPRQGTGLRSVLVEGQPIARVNDKTEPYEENVPCKECCRTHVATVIDGSRSVYAGGQPVAWVGSKAQGITGNPSIIDGARSVTVGR
jgi:uncharacterized Zn-binding protein involved in type VI secretion